MSAFEDRAFTRVPDVVGLPFSFGQQEASASGLHLANPDPDGPPASALAWPADLVIVAQDPVAGKLQPRGESIKVWLQGGPDAVAVRSFNPLGADSAHAVPDPLPAEVDLTTSDNQQ